MTAVFARTPFHGTLNQLTDRHLLRQLAYVGGRWTSSSQGNNYVVTDPATGATLVWVASLDGDETTSAIDAATRAFAGWRDLLPQERAALLRKWGELMLAARDDLALIMTLEQGKPIAEARGEIDYAASFFDWYAEEGKRLNAESVTSHLAGAEMIVRREALGVVG
ncbi:aldehyde dehydrogenase family protein, partial [Ensifer sp. 4252]|uniref:aldehyde dehydrogenase family protein n=1 Tax=Ensifer sp. 4252 TaxID=3373915 RepID=UPI003D25931C